MRKCVRERYERGGVVGEREKVRGKYERGGEKEGEWERKERQSVRGGRDTVK